MKEVRFGNDEQQFVSLKAKPNFRVLGKKVDKLMKAAQEAIDKLDQNQLSLLMDGDDLSLDIAGEAYVLTSEDIQVERQVKEGMIAANQGPITIALDTALTEDLLIEGLARELVNKLNTMRREAGFEVTDRIHVRIETSNRVQSSFMKYAEYIQGEVLALTVEFGACDGSEWDLNGEPAKIILTKA